MLFDVALGNVAEMGNDFQCQVLRRHASAALANALGFVQSKMAVKGDEHLLDLLKKRLRRWRRAKPVKEYGIALDFRDLQPNVVCLNQLFEKLFNDMAAVRNFSGLHELRKAADIRNE